MLLVEERSDRRRFRGTTQVTQQQEPPPSTPSASRSPRKGNVLVSCTIRTTPRRRIRSCVCRICPLSTPGSVTFGFAGSRYNASRPATDSSKLSLGSAAAKVTIRHKRSSVIASPNESPSNSARASPIPLALVMGLYQITTHGRDAIEMCRILRIVWG
jgi:hypothetical protein